MPMQDQPQRLLFLVGQCLVPLGHTPVGKARAGIQLPQKIRMRGVRQRGRIALGILAMIDTPYHPPAKRSVEIAGHKTSISLEPLFWEMLHEAAGRAQLPLNALVARIDAERIEAEHQPGLATAIRLWLVADLRQRLSRV